MRQTEIENETKTKTETERGGLKEFYTKFYGMRILRSVIWKLES